MPPTKKFTPVQPAAKARTGATVATPGTARGAGRASAPTTGKKMVWKISEIGALNHNGIKGTVVPENAKNFQHMKNLGEIELVPA
jgi:hypothetical protein